jgi:hypothetical protein
MVWQEEFGCPLKVTKAEAVWRQRPTDDNTAIIGISGAGRTANRPFQ